MTAHSRLPIVIALCLMVVGCGRTSDPASKRQADEDGAKADGGGLDTSSWQEPGLCVPDCSGKACGADGCAGICGRCEQPWAMPCKMAVCGPQGACRTEPAPAGTQCDDGDSCTVPDHCSLEGTCIPGPLACEIDCANEIDDDLLGGA